MKRNLNFVHRAWEDDEEEKVGDKSENAVNTNVR